MPPYRKCPCCGKMFAVISIEEVSTKKYCSRKCSVKYRRRLKRRGGLSDGGKQI